VQLTLKIHTGEVKNSYLLFDMKVGIFCDKSALLISTGLEMCMYNDGLKKGILL